MVEDTSDFTRYIKSVLHDNKPPSSNVYKKLTFGDSVETQGICLHISVKKIQFK